MKFSANVVVEEPLTVTEPLVLLTVFAAALWKALLLLTELDSVKVTAPEVDEIVVP